MESEPKQRFNNQLMQQSHRPDLPFDTDLNTSPQKRILALVKSGNVNGLKNYLQSIDNPSEYINTPDKEFKQTVLYQAVQIKDRDVAYLISECLLKNQVSI
jgi:hypothetical protein